MVNKNFLTPKDVLQQLPGVALSSLAQEVFKETYMSMRYPFTPSRMAIIKTKQNKNEQ